MPDTYHVFSAERGAYRVDRAGADGVTTVHMHMSKIGAVRMADELNKAANRSYDMGLAVGQAEFSRAIQQAF